MSSSRETPRECAWLGPAASQLLPSSDRKAASMYDAPRIGHGSMKRLTRVEERQQTMGRSGREVDHRGERSEEAEVATLPCRTLVKLLLLPLISIEIAALDELPVGLDRKSLRRSSSRSEGNDWLGVSVGLSCLTLARKSNCLESCLGGNLRGLVSHRWRRTRLNTRTWMGGPKPGGNTQRMQNTTTPAIVARCS